MIPITDIWNDSHQHLIPFIQHLPLQPDQYRNCPLCKSGKSFYVLADLELVGDSNRNTTEVLFCPDCTNFLVDGGCASRRGGVLSRDDILGVRAKLWISQPALLNVEPTTRCNFSCWYCVGRHMEQIDIETARFQNILANSKEVKTIALVGEGEPLLHAEFFTMVKLARRDSRIILSVSNGSLLDENNVRSLCESGVHYLAISIDSTDARQFASSRLNGNLSDVLAGMMHLRKYRDQNGFKYPKIGIKGTLLDDTRGELIPIVNLARTHGAEIFESFQTLNPKNSYKDIYPEKHQCQIPLLDEISSSIDMDSIVARKFLQPVQDFFQEEEVDFFSVGRRNILRNNCDENSLHVLASGQITSCCQVKDPFRRELNLAEMPLAEITKDPGYENLRFNLWNGIFPKNCMGCLKTKPVSGY